MILKDLLHTLGRHSGSINWKYRFLERGAHYSSELITLRIRWLTVPYWRVIDTEECRETKFSSVTTWGSRFHGRNVRLSSSSILWGQGPCLCPEVDLHVEPFHYRRVDPPKMMKKWRWPPHEKNPGYATVRDSQHSEMLLRASRNIIWITML